MITSFTDSNGKVADELVAFGLTEGSNRVHVGQGTANRKFYFENFFLEIIWVSNPDEITSDLVLPTGLWDRANYKMNGFSPFGLCLTNDAETKALFEKSISYHPVYFPKGVAFDILSNERHPDLPWTCLLPVQTQSTVLSEPIVHENGLKRLTKATFAYTSLSANEFVDFFKKETTIEFVQAANPKLLLTFDEGRQGKTKEFATLSLEIVY